MPVKLIVVIVLLGLSLLLDLYGLTGEGGAVVYIRIALNIALLAGLLRGQEWARGLAKVMGILCLVGGGIVLVQLLALGSLIFLIPTLGYIALISVGLLLVYGTFLLWTMGQADVQEWLASRNLRD
ncbi:MAG: hypothetical protein H0T76_25100 [Nannocystis sp.]|nr:hypothetical protein [Nannocystis sp.]MBA3549771.1 hypothetical protein [Nannocystis sp.]